MEATTDMQNKLKYVKILNNICNYYGVNEDKFIELLKDRENKYICKDINNSLRLAEEKLLVNRFFREKYFELENNIEKIDMTNL
jgi:hypothetical protein